MIAAVLAEAALDPTLVVGGRLNSVGANARLGKGDFMVVESDESDRSFLLLAPIIAVITNIDREHLDHYGTLEELQRAYAQFANRVPFYGAAIVCRDEENVRQILPELRRRVITYGLEGGRPEADLVICDAACGHFESQFRLRFRGSDLGRFQLRVPGQHNVLNATAAVVVGLELKIDPDKIRTALAGFQTVDRRFQVRGEADGVTVVDDYGHHPTEIRVTLSAARQCRFERVYAIFQPHRYSRTALLAEEFARCFDGCDFVYVLDIYAAGESPIDGISAEWLVERMHAAGFGAAEYASSAEELLARLAKVAQPGDLVLTLGAGNVWQAGEEFLERLRARSTGVPAEKAK
jgi:UDP-N-acetylmuramate--alanine ligase